jgi:hypothetical protein
LLPHERIRQIDLTREQECSIIRALPFDHLNGTTIMEGF